jgi:hypothetical protein
MTKKPSIPANEGIVADNVSATVLAVGKNATAVQNLSSDGIAQFRSSVAELKRAIEGLKIPENAKAAISEHVKGLEIEAGKPAPDRNRVEGALKALSSSAKLLGEFVTNAKIILAPIVKIAALFGFAAL